MAFPPREVRMELIHGAIGASLADVVDPPGGDEDSQPRGRQQQILPLTTPWESPTILWGAKVGETKLFIYEERGGTLALLVCPLSPRVEREGVDGLEKIAHRLLEVGIKGTSPNAMAVHLDLPPAVRAAICRLEEEAATPSSPAQAGGSRRPEQLPLPFSGGERQAS